MSAVAFPVLLVVLIPATSGGGDTVLDSGVRLTAFLAGTMVVHGAAVTGYASVAEGVADDHGRGVLKRAHGSPLPRWAMLAGWVVGAVFPPVIEAVSWVFPLRHATAAMTRFTLEGSEPRRRATSDAVRATATNAQRCRRSLST